MGSPQSPNDKQYPQLETASELVLQALKSRAARERRSSNLTSRRAARASR